MFDAYIPPKLHLPPPAIIRPAQRVIKPRAAMLRINNLIGFGFGSRPLEASFVGLVPDDEADLSTYTFTDANVGAAHPTRLVVVTINTEASGTGAGSLTSVTIGGVAASIAVQRFQDNGSNRGLSAIAYALVPTGTTATITVVLTFTCVRMRVGVYRLINQLSNTPRDFD